RSVLGWGLAGRSCHTFNLDWNSSRVGVRPRPAAGVLFPPQGEEKKSRVEVQRHVLASVAAAVRDSSARRQRPANTYAAPVSKFLPSAPTTVVDPEIATESP